MVLEGMLRAYWEFDRVSERVIYRVIYRGRTRGVTWEISRVTMA